MHDYLDQRKDVSRTISCPECESPMHAMGQEFKPPRRNNIRQWRKVELLFQRGYRWETGFKWVNKTTGTAKYSYSYKVPVSHSPRAKTLRDARTDYPPQE